METIHVVAALITDAEGRALLVRKRGTTAFMQAGGKLEPGETPAQALVRELREELGVEVPEDAPQRIGTFDARAANEDAELSAEVFTVTVEKPRAGGEIEELLWLDPSEHRTDLAPLTTRLLARLARDRSALSFGAETANYERGRPEYPREAVDWMLPADARDVVDVGAGTGKLTGVLVATGRTVTAVDPDAGMLAALQRKHAGVVTKVGSGERIPMGDAEMDAVTFGQAWHWVDPSAASGEVARVLRPGGTLGLVWNIRDESEPWVAELTQVMKGSAAEQLIASTGPIVAAPFGRPEHATWHWHRHLSVDDVVAMAASRSYVITAPADQRARVLDGVERLAEDNASDGIVTMPYVTHAYRVTRGTWPVRSPST